MCGLCGWFCFSDARPTRENFDDMMLEIESRGTDATGYAYFNEKGLINVIKAPIPATKFLKSSEVKKLFNKPPKILIAHTRAKTKGTPTKYVNNHPIYVGQLALVHNGMIHNDDELFKELKLSRRGEVDSEILARILQDTEKLNYERGLKTISSKCEGSAAMAVLSVKHPNKLLLARSNNPIELFVDRERDILFFASTETAAKKGVVNDKKMEKWRGLEVDMTPNTGVKLPIDSGMLIGEKGVEKTYEFNIPYSKTIFNGWESGSCVEHGFGTNVAQFAWLKIPVTTIKHKCASCKNVLFVKWIHSESEFHCRACFCVLYDGDELANEHYSGGWGKKKRQQEKKRLAAIAGGSTDWKFRTKCDKCNFPETTAMPLFDYEGETICQDCINKKDFSNLKAENWKCQICKKRIPSGEIPIASEIGDLCSSCFKIQDVLNEGKEV